MKHEFSDALRADPERFGLAQTAAKQLDEITANTRFRARAIWEQAGQRLPSLKMKLEPALHLAITDEAGNLAEGYIWPGVPVTAGMVWPDDGASIHRLTFQVAQIWDEYLKSLQISLFESSLATDADTSGVIAL